MLDRITADFAVLQAFGCDLDDETPLTHGAISLLYCHQAIDVMLKLQACQVW